MISFNHENIYLYSHPVDMRKSIDGLAALLSDLNDYPLQDGSITLFYNHYRDKVKLLYWDKNGFVVIYKRLEKGRFKIVNYDRKTNVVSLETNQLTWLLAGLDYNLMNEFKSLDFSNYY